MVDINEAPIEDHINLARQLHEKKEPIMEKSREFEKYAYDNLIFIIGVITGVMCSTFSTALLNIVKSFNLIDFVALIISFAILLIILVIFYMSYTNNKKNSTKLKNIPEKLYPAVCDSLMIRLKGLGITEDDLKQMLKKNETMKK